MRRTVTGPSITFCSVVMCGNRLKCWNTMPVVARNLASVFTSGSFEPSPNAKRVSPTRTLPPSGTTSRLMQRSSVDLPEPDGPISATTPPLATSRLMFLRTSLLPKLLRKARISIFDVSLIR